MNPIIRQSVSDLVVANLEELITSGQFAVGERVPTEKELCRTLGVSRTSVRESLRMMKAMGYIDIIPGKGSFVLKTSESNENGYLDWFAKKGIVYSDFMEVRMMLEPWATSQAIQRSTDTEIQELKTIFHEFEAAYHEKNSLGLVRSDEQFHSQIFSMCKNPLLVSINDKIKEYFTEFRVKVYNEESGVSNAIDPHRRILDAFIARNPDAGEQAMKTHIMEIMRDVSTALQIKSSDEQKGILVQPNPNH